MMPENRKLLLALVIVTDKEYLTRINWSEKVLHYKDLYMTMTVMVDSVTITAIVKSEPCLTKNTVTFTTIRQVAMMAKQF